MTSWKALIIRPFQQWLSFTSIPCLTAFSGGNGGPIYRPPLSWRVKDTRSQNRWLVSRGHTGSGPSALSWFMISLPRLCRDDYAGGSSGTPSTTVEVIGGRHMDKEWTDKFLSAALWFQDQSKGVGEPLLYIWSAQLNIEQFIQFISSGRAWPLHNIAVISPSTWFSPRTWLASCRKIVCRVSGERRGINKGLTLPSLCTDPSRLSHVELFSMTFSGTPDWSLVSHDYRERSEVF